MKDDRQTVSVAGATGRAGRLVVKTLLGRGFLVRALAIPPFDSPEQPGLMQAGATVAEADLASPESLEKAVAGADFLISAIGSKKPFSRKENDAIDNIGNRNLARAAKAQGLKKIVVISSIGTGNSWKAVGLFSKLLMRSILRAKDKSETFIRGLGYTYTIIRPGGYSDSELSGEVAFGEGGLFSGRITRQQIAEVCADALENPAMHNRTFEVVDASTVPEAHRQSVITL